MHDFRSYLRQRLQHEAAMLHRGMRDAQFPGIQSFVAKKNNIHIDGPRPFRFRPPSSHGLFNPEQTPKKFQWPQFGLHGCGTVQEPGLLADDLYRLRLIKGRNPADGPQCTQSGDCFTKIGFAVTQIRAEREVCSPFQWEKP